MVQARRLQRRSHSDRSLDDIISDPRRAAARPSRPRFQRRRRPILRCPFPDRI